MTRIADAFARDGKAFVAYVCAGDPTLQATERIVHAMVEAGADIVELGIPFSDPTAEGPVIMEATERALAAGTTTDGVFALAARLRQAGVQVPLVYMTYANVVYGYGVQRFMRAAAESGADGLILPDVPFEEKGEFEPAAARAGLDLISMVAPTSAERVEAIAREARGFVYVVSSLGVTGVRSSITTDVAALARQVRAVSRVPACVGFGISTPEQAAAMAQASDGAIVGSAIVRLVAEHGEAAAEPVAAYVRRMSQAVHGS